MQYVGRQLRAEHRQEVIGSLGEGFFEIMREYEQINHCFPKKIIVYRDGVGEG